jgi:hypothetical protein
MPHAEQHLAPLSAPERAKLESWLADFDLAWNEDLLARRAHQLPRGDRLRVPALIEMIKIDLERRWQRGRQVVLESYLKAYPELASPEGPPAVLLRAEVEVRSQFGAPPAQSELLRRFPGQADLIRQLAARSTATQPPARRSELAARETRRSISSTPSAAPRSAANRSLPEQFGKRYRIIKRLGQGGMGTVFLARDTQLDRPVALKVPQFTPEDGPEILQRFYQEARIAATLDHPNICPIYDVGEIEGVPYLTMKCIAGKPLTDFIQPDKPLPLLQVAALVHKVALALQVAHGRRIVHRDLKPSNIMIQQNGEPVVMDFGLASRAHRQDSVRLTQTGTPLGTPDAGVAALLEWAQRPLGPTPAWVLQAVEGLAASGLDTAAWGVLRSAPSKLLGQLTQRLGDLDTPDADALIRHVRQGNVDRSNRYLLGAGVFVLLALPLLFIFLLCVQQEVRGLGGACMLGAMALGFVALGFLMAALEVRLRFRAGAKRPPKTLA